MSPVEWAILPLKRYAQFTGRAPRAEYWWFYLGTVIAGFFAGVLDGLTHIEVFQTVLNLALIVPSLAVTVRRLHDTDRTGWWLVAIIPSMVAGFVATVTAGAAFQRQQLQLLGSASIALMVAAVIAVVILAIALLIFMIMPGTEGPNRYGPDPYGPGALEEVFA
jgi:uncharacterized membrane protein YhaH (DUF805 family)